MTKHKHSNLYTQIAFWLCFLLVGIPFWIQPYNQLTLPNSLFHIGLVAVPMAALLLRSVVKLSLRDAVLPPAIATIAVVVVRIIVELFLVPDSHNLWPFELIITSLLGCITAGVGGLLGNLVAKVTLK